MDAATAHSATGESTAGWNCQVLSFKEIGYASVAQSPLFSFGWT